nr:hypothetical protein [uncultured Desulfuromonas sp.]
MTPEQVREQIEQQRRDEHDFVVWTEPEQSSDDVELVDYFLRQRLDAIGEVNTVSLMTLEELWQRLMVLDGDHLSRHWRKKVEVMDWQVTDGQGRTRVRSCSFRPEGVLAVYEELVAAGRGESGA